MRLVAYRFDRQAILLHHSHPHQPVDQLVNTSIVTDLAAANGLRAQVQDGALLVQPPRKRKAQQLFQEVAQLLAQAEAAAGHDPQDPLQLVDASPEAQASRRPVTNSLMGQLDYRDIQSGPYPRHRWLIQVAGWYGDLRAVFNSVDAQAALYRAGYTTQPEIGYFGEQQCLKILAGDPRRVDVTAVAAVLARLIRPFLRATNKQININPVPRGY